MARIVPPVFRPYEEPPIPDIPSSPVVSKTTEPAGGPALPSVMEATDEPTLGELVGQVAPVVEAASQYTPMAPVASLMPPLMEAAQQPYERSPYKDIPLLGGVTNAIYNTSTALNPAGDVRRGYKGLDVALTYPGLGQIPTVLKPGAGIAARVGANIAENFVTDLGAGVSRGVGGALVRAGEDVFNVGPKPAVRMTSRSGKPAAQVVDDIIEQVNRQALELGDVAKGLPWYETLANKMRGRVGLPLTHDVTTPIAAEYGNIIRRGESLAHNIAAEAAVQAKVFDADANGLIPALANADFPNGPTLQDVAARLPEFQDNMTIPQLQAMDWFRKVTEPFEQQFNLIQEVAGKLADSQPNLLNKRADIIEGGFYLPRGGADLIGRDEPARVVVGGRSRSSYKLPARFDSMAYGIEQGYEYAHGTPAGAIEAYIKNITRDMGERATANRFIGMADDAGTRLAQTAIDRVDPTLRSDVQKLAVNLARQKDTAALQAARGMMATRSARSAAAKAAKSEGFADTAWKALMDRVNNAPSEELLSAAERDLMQLRADAKKAYGKNVRATISAKDAGYYVGKAREMLDSVQKVGDDLIQAAQNRVGGLPNDLAGQSAISNEVDTLRKQLTPLGRVRADAAKRFEAAIERAAKMTNATDQARAEAAAADEALKAAERYTKGVQRAVARDNVMTAAANQRFNALNQAAARDARFADIQATRQGNRFSRLINTINEIDKREAELFDLRGRYRHAKEQAAVVPRDRGRISLPGLQNYDFPLEYANGANMVLKGIEDARRPGLGKALIGLYRTSTATLDNSATMIQGMLGWSGDPKASAKALEVNMKTWADPDAYGWFVKSFNEKAATEGLLSADDWANAGLRTAGQSYEVRPGYGISEAVSKGLRKIPVAGKGFDSIAKGAEKADAAFNAYTDTLRLSWAQDEARTLMSQVQRPLTPDEIKGIATSINRFSGYTPEAFGGGIADAIFYSPRYLKAKLETLGNAAVSTKGLVGGKVTLEQEMARGAVLRNLGFTAGLTLAANAALGNETDIHPLIPDGHGGWKPNSNFMTIRWNGQDWTLFGSPYRSFLMSVLSVAAGKPDYAFRSQVTGLWGRMLVDIVEGQTLGGLRVRDNPYQLLRYVALNSIPFAASQAAPTVMETAQRALRGDVPGTVAGAASAYIQVHGLNASPPSYSDIVQQVVNDVVRGKGEYAAGTTIDNLAPEDRRAVMDDPRVGKALEKFEPAPPDDRHTVQVAMEAYDATRTSLEKQLSDVIAKGAKGETLRKAVQQFKHDRWRASQDFFEAPNIKAALERTQRERFNLPLRAQVAERYWSIEAPEDAEGLPDLNQLQKLREGALQEAAALGVSKEYITGNGPNTYRGERYKDPKVKEVINQYEEDIERLRPYFDIREQSIAKYEGMRNMDRMAKEAAKAGNLARQQAIESRLNQGIGIFRIRYLMQHRELVPLLDRWGYKRSPRLGGN